VCLIAQPDYQGCLFVIDYIKNNLIKLQANELFLLIVPYATNECTFLCDYDYLKLKNKSIHVYGSIESYPEDYQFNYELITYDHTDLHLLQHPFDYFDLKYPCLSKTQTMLRSLICIAYNSVIPLEIPHIKTGMTKLQEFMLETASKHPKYSIHECASLCSSRFKQPIQKCLKQLKKLYDGNKPIIEPYRCLYSHHIIPKKMQILPPGICNGMGTEIMYSYESCISSIKELIASDRYIHLQPKYKNCTFQSINEYEWMCIGKYENGKVTQIPLHKTEEEIIKEHNSKNDIKAKLIENKIVCDVYVQGLNIQLKEEIIYRTDEYTVVRFPGPESFLRKWASIQLDSISVSLFDLIQKEQNDLNLKKKAFSLFLSSHLSGEFFILNEEERKQFLIDRYENDNFMNLKIKDIDPITSYQDGVVLQKESYIGLDPHTENLMFTSRPEQLIIKMESSS
jgi:hypothetical protein